jgi:hypothetical protein
MIITNKRVSMPKLFDFEDISIEVVDNFKLLGVTIDNKLQFNKFVSLQCSQINKKIYSIKKLFYLPFEVKIQFFKTFLLPYFDYCISLLIYYQKTAIQRLCKMYYFCLKKLFNFSFLGKTHDEIIFFLVKDPYGPGKILRLGASKTSVYFILNTYILTQVDEIFRLVHNLTIFENKIY